MAVHLLHVGKTGGTALKQALAGRPNTFYGPLQSRRHHVTLRDVPDGDWVVFCVRDPVSRFFSGFYSRLRQGRPRYDYPWTKAEAWAFSRYPTPQELAEALADDDSGAAKAMRSIRHVRDPLAKWLVGRKYLSERAPWIVYIARQETLDADWVRLRAILGVSPDRSMPIDDVEAHRSGDDDRSLSARAEKALCDWYAKDYLILEWCSAWRRARGWQ